MRKSKLIQQVTEEVMKGLVMTKTRRKFTTEEKQKAVSDYHSGKRTAKQIADDFDSKDTNLVHRWKYELEVKSNGGRVEELKNNGYAVDAAKRIRELEAEVLEYQKIVAEQTVILDLLKKHRAQRSSVFGKRSSGLTDTIKQLDPKRKPQ